MTTIFAARIDIVGLVLNLFLGLVLFVLLLASLLSVRRRSIIRKFCRAYEGKSLLVVGTRSGWHDFIQNNVMPALPDTSAVLWVPRRHRKERMPFPANAVQYMFPRLPRPFYLTVANGHATVMLLHDALMPYKSQIGRDGKVIEEVKRLLRDNASPNQ
jgi:hypothetical protein